MDGKKCKEIGDTFEKILDTTQTIEEWKVDIANHNKTFGQNERLFEVVTKKKNLEIKVNYEKKLSSLFKEVRNL